MTTMRNEGTIPQWSLGDKLAKALDHAGMSVQDMADELGVSRNTISNYTAGRTKVTRATLVVWALRTGVDLNWLENSHGPGDPTPHVEAVNPDPAGGDALKRLTQSKRERSGHAGGASTRRYQEAA